MNVERPGRASATRDRIVEISYRVIRIGRSQLLRLFHLQVPDPLVGLRNNVILSPLPFNTFATIVRFEIQFEMLTGNFAGAMSPIVILKFNMNVRHSEDFDILYLYIMN